jgi:hypothetical protein
LTTRPPRTMWFQPEPTFSCSGEGLAGADLGAGRRVDTPSSRLRFPLRSLCSGRLRFFPLTATTIVSSVVSSTAAALKLLFGSDTLSRWVLVTAGHIPRCIAAVMLRMSKPLAAFALQRPLWGVIRLHLYSQTPEIGERTHFRHVRASRHRHNKVWCQGTVLLGVLIPSL